jgi:multiple sugar transport system permease protein
MTSDSKTFHRKTSLSKQKTETIAAYVFLLPALVGLIIFVFLPMFYALWVSFHEWDALSSMKWVGLNNFKDMLADKDWLTTLGRTFKYTFVFAPALYVTSLILALIVQSIPRFTGTFRTMFFLPVVMSSVVTGLLWKLMLDEKNGLVNSVFDLLHIPPVPWLSSLTWALPSIISVSVWMAMGFYMIIFLAGLQDIPKDYYEAARIDGANSLQSFWKITLPCLRHTSIFVLIVSIIGSFQAFDQIKIMTNGGPASATKLGVQHIYESSFTLYEMGYASALSFSLFVIILLFTMIQMKVLSINEE